MLHYIYSYVKSGFYLLFLQTRKSSQTGLNQAQYAQPSSTGYSTQQSSSVDLSCGSHKAMTTTVVSVDKGNNKITELRTILQRESQNS